MPRLLVVTDPDTALGLYNQGRLARDLGDLQEAKRLLERALAIWKKMLAPGNPDVAAGLTSLAVVYQDLGK
ncbi:MAG: tetratricopeptide repeat protein, partial [Nitrospirota bacterium]